MIQQLAHLTGHQILSVRTTEAYQRCVSKLIKEQQINLVVDVGANLGQFAMWIRQGGYRDRIVSFEPLAQAHHQLINATKRDPLWTAAPRMALGSRSGEMTIHVAHNSVSSSILPMLNTHLQAAPESAYVKNESVLVNRLDDVCPTSSTDRLLLKVDVQGYERDVLEGAPRLLEACRLVIVEMSLVPLYQGQTLALDLWESLAKLGFEAHYFDPGFRDPHSDRMLQMDGLFVRQ